jgi:hypothetical protein
MSKNKNNSLIIWVASILIIISVIVAVFYNQIIAINWDNDHNGLKLNREQNSNNSYLGEEYICDKNKSLFIQINGSVDDVNNRIAQMTMVDRHSGLATSPNMKIKSVKSNSVSYAYKENMLIINDNDEATFLINNIKIVENCKKNNSDNL